MMSVCLAWYGTQQSPGLDLLSFVDLSAVGQSGACR